MKIKTTFEFSDGTTITLTKEQVEELRAALAVPAKSPFDIKPNSDLEAQILRMKERDAARETKPKNPFDGPRLWDGTEWKGTPIPIICEATQ